MNATLADELVVLVLVSLVPSVVPIPVMLLVLGSKVYDFMYLVFIYYAHSADYLDTHIYCVRLKLKK